MGGKTKGRFTRVSTSHRPRQSVLAKNQAAPTAAGKQRLAAHSETCKLISTAVQSSRGIKANNKVSYLFQLQHEDDSIHKTRAA